MTAAALYDAAIVGAGPAGTSCAIRLARAGLRVMLVEQKAFPRAKLCGEFISPECLEHFRDLGVLDQMEAAGGTEIQRTVFYAGANRSVTVPSEWFGTGAAAMGLSRAEMDAVLLRQAFAAGVEVFSESHAAPVIGDEYAVTGLRITTGTTVVAANAGITIDATGRTRALGRQIEKSRSGASRTRADFVAFKAHLERAAIPAGDCEIYAYRGGYGGCSGVENGLHNLCFIVPSATAKQYQGDGQRLMHEVVSTNARAAQTLAAAAPVGDWLAVPIERYGRAELAPAEGLMAVGDAAGFIDPFTGSGILLALESSKLATDAILAHYEGSAGGSFSSVANAYRSAYSAAFDRRLRIGSLLRYAAFVPRFAGALLYALSLSDRLTRRLAMATRPA